MHENRTNLRLTEKRTLYPYTILLSPQFGFFYVVNYEDFFIKVYFLVHFVAFFSSFSTASHSSI